MRAPWSRRGPGLQQLRESHRWLTATHAVRVHDQSLRQATSKWIAVDDEDALTHLARASPQFATVVVVPELRSAALKATTMQSESPVSGTKQSGQYSISLGGLVRRSREDRQRGGAPDHCLESRDGHH